MAFNALWFIATTAILFGSCYSEDSCTRNKTYRCIWDNLATNKCFKYTTIIACINGFLDKCTGDVRAYANDRIARMKEERNMCPGLPEGKCYYNAMDDCGTVNFGEVGPKGEQMTSAQCQTLNSISKKAKDCLELLKPKCPASRPMASIKDSIRFMNEATKTCASKYGRK